MLGIVLTNENKIRSFQNASLRVKQKEAQTATICAKWQKLQQKKHNKSKKVYFYEWIVMIRVKRFYICGIKELITRLSS